MAPTSPWTTVHFCNEPPWWGGTQHESRSASFGIRPPQLVASTAEKTRPEEHLAGGAGSQPKEGCCLEHVHSANGAGSRQFDWRLRNPEKSPAGRGAEKQGAEMQGHVYPPPPNLPRSRIRECSVVPVFVNYQTSRRRDDQDRAVLRTSAGVRVASASGERSRSQATISRCATVAPDGRPMG
jgi:hypothetical protein